MKEELRIAHVFANDISKVPRLIKSMLYMDPFLDRAHVIGVDSSNEAYRFGSEKVIVKRIKAPFLDTYKLKNIAFVRYLDWYVKSYLYLRRKKIQVLHAHSIEDLPLAYWYKVFNRGVKLIYEPHEFETERRGWFGINKFMAKKVEKYCMRKVNHTITVSNSIKDWYISTYTIDNSNISVIRNIPMILKGQTKETNVPKDYFLELYKIKKEDVIFIYQGGLIQGRGITLLLEAFKKVNNSHHIVFMGYGGYENKIVEAAKEYDNIHFHQSVPYDDLLGYTKLADVGIHMIENSCLNNFYCLPNKIFEYLLADISIVCSDFPDMKSVVDQYDVGWTVKPELTPLIDLINNIDKSKLKKQKDINIDWYEELNNLKFIYERNGL